MIKLHFQLVFIAAVSLGLAAENPNPVTLGGFQAVSLNSSMKIQYEIAEFELQQIDQNGKSYINLNMGNAGSMSDPGEPYLPTVSTYYAVEPGKSFSVVVNVQETETIPNVNILPFESWDANLTGKLVKGDSYAQRRHH